MYYLKHRKTKLVLFIVIGVLFIACASILPAAKTDFKEAKELNSNGKKLESIDKAISAVIVQTNYEAAQKFVFKNWDESIPPAVAEAKSLENTQEIEGVERKVHIYGTLVHIYDNLAKLELPFAHPKGRWSWETKIVDYKPDFDKSVTHAFNIFFDAASKNVAETKLKESYDLFNRMYNKYTIADKKTSVADSIANVYNVFAKKYELSNSIDEVKNSYKAYGYSLKFVADQAEIKVAYEAAATRVAFLYVEKAKKMYASNDVKILEDAIGDCNTALKWNSSNTEAQPLIEKLVEKIYSIHFAEGLALENKNTITSLEESLKYYDLALKWKKDDPKTIERIAIVKEKLAEKFYQLALALEKQDAAKDEIIKNYKLAQKWIPDYKDSQKRIHAVTIIDEIKKLEKNIAVTYKENERTRNNVSSASSMLGQAENGLDKITYVSDKFRDLHSSMKTVITTCSAIGGIPVIGTIATTAKTTVTVAKEPIDKVVLTFNSIEDPVVKPSKKVVSNSKSIVDSVNTKMQTISKTLGVAKTSARVFRECLENMEKAEDLKEVEDEIKVVNTNLEKFNNEYKNLNNSINAIKEVASTFYGYVKPIEQIEGGIRSVSGAISTIKSATDGINSVLKKTIPIPFADDPSIKDILNASTGALGYLMDKAMEPLKPYLKKLANQIPPIPGVNEFTQNVEKLKGEYEKINNEFNKAKASYDKLTNYEKQMKDSFNKIIDKTGCGTKI